MERLCESAANQKEGATGIDPPASRPNDVPFLGKAALFRVAFPIFVLRTRFMAIPRLFEKSKVLLDVPAVSKDDLADPGLADSEPRVSDTADTVDTSDVDGPNANDEMAVDTTDLNKPAAEISPAAAPTRRPGAYDDLVDGEPEEPADEVDEPATEEKPAAVAASEFAPELLEQAKGHGIDEETAKRFGSAENLQWAIADRIRIRAELGQQLFAAMQQQQPQQQAQQAAAQQAPAPQAAQQLDGKVVFDRKKYAEKGFDDDTLDLMSDITDQFNAKLESATQGVQQITSQSQAEEQARIARDTDAFFDELGPDWQETFGKGLLAPNSPQLTERHKVFQTAMGLYMADAQSNQPPQPLAKQLQTALNALHFQKQQEIALKQKADAAGKRRGQAIARAGAQRTPPITGEEKAFARSRSFDRKHRVGI
jgi:hypothetical protein